MSERTTTIPQMILTRLVRGRAAVDMLLVVGATALIALAAQVWIRLPFTPVPMTLQPLAVVVVGALLGRTRGAAAATLYLLEGMSGLPVFAEGHGGPMWLAAPTAGYLWSYPFAAFVAGWFSEHGWTGSAVRAIPGMLASLALIYAGGFAWLAMLHGAAAAYTLGVAPFLLADVVKVAIGAVLLPQAQRALLRL